MEESRLRAERDRKFDPRERSRLRPWTVVAGIVTEIGFSGGLTLALAGLCYLFAFAVLRLH